jgi:hypothetical protein
LPTVRLPLAPVSRLIATAAASTLVDKVAMDL